MQTIRSVLIDKIHSRERVDVYLVWPGMYIDTTGTVIPTNELRWAKLNAERYRLLYLAVGEVLNILQKHSCSLAVDVNSNGLNYIHITFDGNSLRGGAIGFWPYFDAPYQALLDLSLRFDLSFIINNELRRYCFDRLGHLKRVVDIDDGGC